MRKGGWPLRCLRVLISSLVLVFIALLCVSIVIRSGNKWDCVAYLFMTHYTILQVIRQIGKTERYRGISAKISRNDTACIFWKLRRRRPRTSSDCLWRSPLNLWRYVIYINMYMYTYTVHGQCILKTSPWGRDSWQNSLIYPKKDIGPKTVPCGTPCPTGSSLLVPVLVLTQCL